MTIDELCVQITANASNFEKSINQVNKRIDSMQKQTKTTTNSMAKSFITAGLTTKVITSAIGLVTRNLDSAIIRLDALNNYPRVMSNLGISTEDAETSMQRLSDALIGLPTTLDSATQSVQRFTSANGNVKASTEMFLALNNAILAGGTNSQIQASALEQLSQAYAKGKPDMMEWRTAMMAMPAQLNQVAKAMGYVSSSELGESLRTGAVSMDEFMLKIIELNKTGANGFKSFEEQARGSTGGVATSITNVKTAFTRGLADIMNAIGQSNIAGFFQGIASVINKVVPYITAFVKVVGMAVSSIASLFGGKGTAGATKEANKTSVALDGLGASGTNASEGIDEATNSAGALKKELQGLAGFDEMQVLKENDSGGTSTGTVGGAVGGAMSGIDWDSFTNGASESTNKVQEIVDKMLEILKPLMDINLEPLKKSFDNLKGAIKPVADVITSALKTAYEKVLVPLSKFTIEKALPTFFNLLSSAIKVLTPILKAFQKVGEKFLNGFLLPIAKWTGKVVINGIKGLTTVIENLANKINESKTAQKVLEGIATAIASITTAYITFKGVWKIGTLIETGVSAFSTLSKSVSAVVTSMNAMPVATNLIASSMTALQLIVGVLTGQLTIHEAVTALATKAQVAFNTALSTNPVGVTIALIAGLTAGIVALIAVLNQGTQAEKEQAEAMKQKAEQAEDLKNKYLEMQAQQEATINGGLSELAHTQELANEIRTLADEKGNVNEKDQARVQFILTELNEALGTEYEMINGQIQKYDELTMSIDKQIQQKRVQVLMDAQEIEYSEALRKEIEVRQAKEQAYQEFKEARDAYNEKQSGANKERLQSAIKQYQEYDEQCDLVQADICAYEDAMAENLRGNTDEAQRILQDKKGHYDEYLKGLEENFDTEKQDCIDLYNDSITDYEVYRTGLKEKMEGFLHDQIDKLKRHKDDLEEKSKECGKAIPDGMKDGMHEDASYVQSEIRAISDDMDKTFREENEIHSPSAKYERYGKYIDEGIENGIRGNSYGVTSAIGSIAQSLISSFTNLLGIHSPSKIFEELGKNTVAGYTNGIDESSKYAVESIKQMANEVSMVDMTPSINSNEKFVINRNIEANNNLNNNNLINEVQKLADKDVTNHITVNIGEEKLIDKIIDGIRDKSFETNGEVFAL